MVELDLGLGGVELAPALHHRGAGLVAVDVEIEALLAERLFRLPDGGELAAALIERNRQRADDRRQCLPVDGSGGVVVFRRRRRHRQIGIERALADLDGELGDVDAVHRRQHRGAELLAVGDRPRQRARREPVDRAARRQLARIDADDAPVVRLRGDLIGLRVEQLAAPGGEPRFRLRHVGARHLADIEAVAGLLQLLGEHFDVAPVQLQDRLVAQQIHIGGRGVEQHLLLGDAQGLARAHDLALGLADPVGGLIAVVQRLRRGRGNAALLIGLGKIGVLHGIRKHRLNDRVRQRAGIIVAAVGGHREFWAIAGQRLRHVLVGRAQRRALRVERRIVLIGLHQGPFERVGGGAGAIHAEHRTCQSEACDGPTKLRPQSSATHVPHNAPRTTLPAAPGKFSTWTTADIPAANMANGAEHGTLCGRNAR